MVGRGSSSGKETMPRPVTNNLGQILIRLFLILAVTILCLLTPLNASSATDRESLIPNIHDDVSDGDDEDFEEAGDSRIG